MDPRESAAGQTPSHARETRGGGTGPEQPSSWPLPEDLAEAGAPGAEQPLIADRYQILGMLGSGGMGSVYRVRDTLLDEIVALKVLLRDATTPPATVLRFKREVKLARRVTHRNVARTFDFGEHRDLYFLTMELVEGESLASYLRREGTLRIDRAIAILGDICEGLIAAHAAGVIHRDLKPENVMLALDGRTVLTDFGIAQGTFDEAPESTRGPALGTPAYMAPEQVEGYDATERADIYALGAVGYEMLTGELPWQAPTVYEALAMRLKRPPPDPRERRPNVPDALAATLLRCLARDPDDRFPKVADILYELQKVTPPTAEDPTERPRRPSVAAPSVVPDDAAATSVAVLPFKRPPGDENDVFADGFVDELTDTLCMSGMLRVRPWRTVASIASPDMDPKMLGLRLGVQVVVEGAVRKVGDRVRVVIRAVGTADGFQVWARRYDRRAAELLSMSDEIAHAIESALSVTGSTAPRAQSLREEALELYLRTRFDARSTERARVERAVAGLERALTLAPDDLTLITAYAAARVRLWSFGGVEEGLRARAAVEEALEKAFDHAEAWHASSLLKLAAGDAEGAGQDAREALARAPALADAHLILATILSEVGPLASALHHASTALSLDDDLEEARLLRGRIIALLGDVEAGEKYLVEGVGKGFASAATYLLLARLATWRGAVGLARDHVQQGARDDADGARLLAVLAARDSRDLRDRPGVRPVRADSSVRSQALTAELDVEHAALLGDETAVLACLHDAVDTGFLDLTWMDRCPLLTTYRRRAWFMGLRARVEQRAIEVRTALEDEALPPSRGFPR